MKTGFKWRVGFPIYFVIVVVAFCLFNNYPDLLYPITIIISFVLLIFFLVDVLDDKYGFWIIPLFLTSIISVYIFMRPKYDNFAVYYGTLCGKTTDHSRNSTYYYLKYSCFDGDTLLERKAKVGLSAYDSDGDSIKRVLITKGKIIKWDATLVDSFKAIHPIFFKGNCSREIGNDSYEYARFDSNREYDNFGYNVVYLSERSDDSINIHWKTVVGKGLKMDAPASARDTFLVYSNINPKFFDGWHVCHDSLCTPENFAKISEVGYGYIFRGRIYSKDETEKYWNIIEQYKLREAGKDSK